MIAYVVMAEEDDYYPDVQPIGVFSTREAAQAFADANPKSFRGTGDNRYHRPTYSFEVVEVETDPAATWCPRGTEPQP